MSSQIALDVNKLSRFCVTQSDPSVLSRIYEDEINMTVWNRTPSTKLNSASDFIIKHHPNLQLSMVVGPQNVRENLLDTFGQSDDVSVFIEDMTQLVDMFCCLFDLKQAGLRLTVLNKAMCPRFHIDRVPCRLISTYQGQATQWIAHDFVDRSMLAVKSKITANESDISQLKQGDVALLKGDIWEGNEGAALVHRSPALLNDERRLLLTLDCIND